MFRIEHRGFGAPVRRRGGMLGLPIVSLILGALVAAIGVLFVSLIVRGIRDLFGSDRPSADRRPEADPEKTQRAGFDAGNAGSFAGTGTRGRDPAAAEEARFEEIS